jgi:hypothetical protein
MANTALGFPFGIFVADDSPLDSKYGVIDSGVWRPYNDIAEALAAVPIGIRHEGLTVNIATEEYHWKTGRADGDLILKSSGGGGGDFWPLSGSADLTGPTFIDAETAGVEFVLFGINRHLGTFATRAESFNLEAYNGTTAESSIDMNLTQINLNSRSIDGTSFNALFIDNAGINFVTEKDDTSDTATMLLGYDNFEVIADNTLFSESKNFTVEANNSIRFTYTEILDIDPLSGIQFILYNQSNVEKTSIKMIDGTIDVDARDGMGLFVGQLNVDTNDTIFATTNITFDGVGDFYVGPAYDPQNSYSQIVLGAKDFFALLVGGETLSSIELYVDPEELALYHASGKSSLGVSENGMYFFSGLTGGSEDGIGVAFRMPSYEFGGSESGAVFEVGTNMATDNNNVKTAGTIRRTAWGVGSASDGIGLSLAWDILPGAADPAGMIYEITDVTAAAQNGQYRFQQHRNGLLNDVMTIGNDVNFQGDGTGSFYVGGYVAADGYSDIAMSATSYLQLMVDDGTDLSLFSIGSTDFILASNNTVVDIDSVDGVEMFVGDSSPNSNNAGRAIILPNNTDFYGFAAVVQNRVNGASANTIKNGLLLRSTTISADEGSNSFGSRIGFAIRNDRVSTDNLDPLNFNDIVGISYQLTDVSNGAEDGKYIFEINEAGAISSVAEILTGGIRVNGVGRGYEAQSPDGTWWRLTPSNAGASVWTAI